MLSPLSLELSALEGSVKDLDSFFKAEAEAAVRKVCALDIYNQMEFRRRWRMQQLEFVQEEVSVLQDSCNKNNPVKRRLKTSDVNKKKRKKIVPTKEDLCYLVPGAWLNDTVVDIYMDCLMVQNEEHRRNQECLLAEIHQNVLVPRMKVLCSFFFKKLMGSGGQNDGDCSKYEYESVRKWTKSVDVFGSDLVLVPICYWNHWSRVIDIGKKTVSHLNSAPSITIPNGPDILRRWLSDVARERKQQFQIAEWKNRNESVPIQINSDDCGVFICKFAESLCRGWTCSHFCDLGVTQMRAKIALVVASRYRHALISGSSSLDFTEVQSGRVSTGVDDSVKAFEH